MSERRDGHVILGINVLTLGYLPAAWQTDQLSVGSPTDPDYWRRIGALAERGTLDAIFLADGPILGNPSYDANNSRFDPTITWAHVARATNHVGLIATASTTFNDPVELAERLLSLDVLSGGRAAWNLVTSRDTGSANNFGLDEVLGRADRYERGSEFADVVIALWESARTGVDIRHHGRHFDVEGRLHGPASPQGRPVIFQAGGSPQGRALAGRVGDGVFAAELTLEGAIEHYREVKQNAVDFGRSPDDVKILPGLLLTLGSTEEEARRRVDEIYDLGPSAYSVQWLSQAIGHDVSTLELDEPFPAELLDGPFDASTFRGSIGFRQSIFERIRQSRPTVREYLRETRYTGSGHGGFVGTPEQLADLIETWFQAGAIDGFNLQPDRLIDGLEVIADELVPLLRARGLYRHDYATTTLRAHLAASSPTPFATLATTRTRQPA